MQGRGSGLSVRPPSSAGVDHGRELRRGAAAALAEHRDRRLKLASLLLAISMGLGGLQVVNFVAVGFPSGSETGAIGGLVIDSSTEGAVSGANVSIRGTSILQVTDSDGRFVIAAAPAGRADLVIEKEGYRTTTFQIFVNPSPPTSTPPRYDTLLVTPGQGAETQDLASAHDWFIGICLAMFFIGLVLTAMGLVAVTGRRRYRHAVAGCIGAILSFGFFLGTLLGAASMLLIMGARDEFQDRRSMFAPESQTPFSALTRREDDEDEEGASEDGEGGPTQEGEAPYHDREEGEGQMGGGGKEGGAAP